MSRTVHFYCPLYLLHVVERMNRSIGVFIAGIIALQAVMAVGIQHAYADTKTDNDINLTSIAAGFCN